MTIKMADLEGLLCPICQNEIKHELLEKLGLGIQDLETIEELLHENLLMQILEFGKIASRYLKPDTISTDLLVHESLEKLSHRAEELIEKQKQLAKDLLKETEDRRLRVTDEALQKQNQLVVDFQKDIKMLQEEHGKVQREHKEEIEKMNTALLEIQKKIVGVGIGKVGEISVAKELKSACSDDEFLDKASSGGADVVARVMVKGQEVGTIVISVKKEKTWKSEHLEQIKRNLREEQTDWGILVLMVFPSSALNDKMYVDRNGILFVKSEYVSAAYLGLRHAVIHKHQAQAWLSNQRESVSLQEHIVGVLKEWVQGSKLRELFGKIDEANKATLQTEEIMVRLQGYNEDAIKNTRKLQGEIRSCLHYSNQILGELREKLPVKS